MLNQNTDARVTVLVDRGCVAIRSYEMYEELALSKKDTAAMIEALKKALEAME